MNLDFTDAENAFRAEVRAFVRDTLPDTIRDKVASGIHLSRDEHLQWQRLLFGRGWSGPGWPKQFGGCGWDLLQRQIWGTEASLAGAPGLAPMGLGMCGPMLIGHGTPEQRRFTRLILWARIIASGYSSQVFSTAQPRCARTSTGGPR
jgi:alkylation response protein AidB-like acyl-CoA dehydrogenase